MNAAEERLLDAALAQVFAARRRAAAPARTNPWLAAALVLLGVLVTATTMWLARGPLLDTAQEPAPLPPSVSADGRSAIEALPADTQHLVARVLEPAHMDVFRRFRALRKLVLIPLDMHIGPINTRTKLAVWSNPPGDVLAPIAELPALESLQLASSIAMPAAVLAPLARSASLRELHLAGDGVVVDDAFVKALAAIPSLRSLRFDLVRLDAAAIDRLARLPLTSLRIDRPLDFDAAAWRRLCEMPSLDTLALSELGRTFHWQGKELSFWMPAPEDLQALTTLQKLRRLELFACNCRDEHLAALPTSLSELSLHNLELTPDGLRQLRRLAALRRLDVGTRRYDLRPFVAAPQELRRACADAIAEAIDALRLTELRFHGDLTDELQRAIAAQPDLVELHVTNNRIGALDMLASAPALRRIKLCELSSPGLVTLDTLAALRGCKKLDTLELYVLRGPDEADVRKLFGDRVAVTMRR